MTIRSDDRGQAMVLTVVFLTVLCGMAALALDFGSWYQSQRRLQATADSAALAAAQALPQNPSNARVLAGQYASHNGQVLASSEFSVQTKNYASDVARVDLRRPAPGFFSHLFGVSKVTVHAKASALSSAPSKVLHVAPITIGSDNPQLRCGAPCYGQETSMIALPTGNYSGNATNFQLIDLSGQGGRVSAAVVANWLRKGYDSYLGLGNYPGVASTTYNTSDFRAALSDMIGKEVIVFVHSSVNGNEGTAGAQYNEIAWAAFVITGFSGSGAQGTLKGYFTSANVQGLPSGSPSSSFGVRTISLID